MTQKTYGVYGLIEYVATLNIGGNEIKITFKDGSMTQQGIIPASYSTSNPVIQYAIEQLKSFKSGRIKLYKQIAINDSIEEDKPNDVSDKETRQIKVTCIEDAAEYLKENFGIRNLRSKASIEKIAKENGIQFIGI